MTCTINKVLTKYQIAFGLFDGRKNGGHGSVGLVKISEIIVKQDNLFDGLVVIT